MKSLSLVIALFLLVTGPSSAWAGGPRFIQIEARHKSGPVTIRGVAHHVGSNGFTLQTTSHGAYAVNAAPPTHFVEKGRTARVTVVEGNHVGVHGYVRGRTIRAMEVRVYPVAPKPVSVRGTITSIAGNRLQIRTGTGSLTILVTAATVIRTSSAVLTSSGLRVGDRVEARVVGSGHDGTALHIHVYRTRVTLRHVRLIGTMVATNTRSVVVMQSGTRHTVGVTSATRYYSGASRASGSLRAGERVTVYACCTGQPLVATSIHVRITRAVARTTELRGTVVAVSATNLRLDTGHASVVQLQSSTVYEVGAARTTRTGVHVGDLVSVRGRESGGSFRATRIHVFGASRKTTTVRGTVAGVSASSIRVIERGATYTVLIGRRTATHLSGRPIHASQIRSGDRARAVGHLNGHQLQATSVDLNRPVPKVVTIRGTVTSAGASWLVVTRSSGAKDIVRMTSRTRVVLGGRQTTGSALFPGTRVVARGTRSGAEFQAATVTATAKSASETGRLTGMVRRTLLLRRSSGKVVRIDLPSGIAPRDGAHAVSLAQIGRGAYLHVSGYAELSKAIRAVAVTVLHPTVDLRGVISWQGPIASVRTVKGEMYLCRFGKSSAISASRLAASVRPSDIPGGTAVQVVGTLDISGSLAVQTLVARLHSATVRARTDSMDANGLVLKPAGSTVRVRLTSNTTYFQGSHALSEADIVVGDDVTAYGYALSGGAIVARKITVHRRLLGLDGTVGSITGQSFVLTATDGPHTVLVSFTTVVIGTAATVLATGMKVRVTGYLRGDATILATRVRIVKAA
jgi:hypothetical protein